eukprot:jgi/Bigna1/77920/fgenesh1_pg.51_\
MVLPTASRSINKAKGGIDVSKKTLDLRKKRFLTNEDVPSFVAVLSSAATTHRCFFAIDSFRKRRILCAGVSTPTAFKCACAYSYDSMVNMVVGSPIPKSTAPSRKRKKLAKARSPFGEAAIFEGGWKDKAPITGTCMSIEKSHFRLTSAPDPNTVRPIHVLKKSLDNVKRMWISNEDYELINSTKKHYDVHVREGPAEVDPARFECSPWRSISAYLMDDLADRMRQHMLDVLLKSYRLKYPVARFLRIASLPGLQYGARKFAIITTEQDDDDDDDDDEEAAQQRRMMIDVDKSRKTASIEADQGGSEAAAVTAKAVQAAATSKERKTASGKAAVRDLEEAVADLANITDMGAKRLKVKQLLGSAKQMLQAPKFDPRITEAISKIMQHLRETKKGMKSKSKRGKVAAAKGNKKNKNIRKKEKKKKKNKK